MLSGNILWNSPDLVHQKIFFHFQEQPDIISALFIVSICLFHPPNLSSGRLVQAFWSMCFIVALSRCNWLLLKIIAATDFWRCSLKILSYGMNFETYCPWKTELVNVCTPLFTWSSGYPSKIEKENCFHQTHHLLMSDMMIILPDWPTDGC